MKLSKLEMHCINCSDYLVSLCNKYTPHDSELIPLCCVEKFKDLDSNNERDIDRMSEYCKENLEEFEEEV